MRLSFVSVICLICYPLLTYGQQPHYSFNRLAKGMPLAQQRVTAITMDHQGFLWMGTVNALLRFDGYRMTSYRHSDDPGSIGWGEINDLQLDHKGRLWVALDGDGLCTYLRESDQFLRLDLGGNRNPAYNVAEGLACDANGFLWVTTKGGLLRLDPENLNEITPINIPGSGRLISALAAGEGDLWLARGSQLYCVPAGTTTPTAVALSADLAPIRCLTEGLQGHILLATDAGMAVISPDGQVRSFYDRHSHPGFPKDINSLSVDHNGRVWIGSYLEGLALLTADGEALYHYQDKGQSDDLGSRNVWVTYQDPKGNLWFGTDQGPKWISAHHLQIALIKADNKPDSLPDNHVWAFLEEDDSQFWLGTDQGLSLWNQETRKFHSYQPDPERPDDVAANRIRVIHKGQDGSLWLGGRKALHRFSTDRGFWKQYTSKGDLRVGSMRTILEDRFGTLWFGSFHGGLLTYDPKADQLNTFRWDEYKSFTRVRDLLEDRKGFLWVASQDGLGRLDFTQDKVAFVRQLQGKPLAVLTLHESGNGELWIGTGSSIMRLNQGKDLDDLSAFDIGPDQGFVANMVYGILEGETGSLWVSTDQGLYRIEPEQQTVVRYRYYHGLQGDDFNSGAAMQDRKGRFFLGGSDGFNVFHPQELVAVPSQPDLVLTDLHLLHQEVRSNAGDGPLHGALADAHQITLNYQQKIVSFGFSALDYTAPQHLHYAYRLDRFDEDWVFAETQFRRAVYTNLDPGSYQFRVKTQDSLGRWQDKEISVSIRVTPAPWNTYQARAIYVLIILSLVYLFVRSRARKLEKERQHSKALEEKNKEIIKAQSQMVMQEKMASVGLLTAGIAHEIKNPTTFTRISAQNLSADMDEFQGWLLELAGDDVAPEFESLLNERMKLLYNHLELIREGTSRIVALAQNLQTFSRADNATREVALVDGIQSTLNLVRSKFRDHINFVTQFNNELRTWCRPGQMNQVFMNLVVNACEELRAKYEETGEKGTLTVKTTSRDGLGYIHFIDTGRGMAPEIIDKIFEPLFSTKNASEGTGLGLSITARIVQEHQGDIEVNSQVGAGSTFTLKIPAYGPRRNGRDTLPGLMMEEPKN